jgi:hypothetical protein
MPTARVRFQNILAEELRWLVTDTLPGIEIPEASSEASAGALWGSIRSHLIAQPLSTSTLTADLTYLTFAPIIASIGKMEATRQERTLSVA